MTTSLRNVCQFLFLMQGLPYNVDQVTKLEGVQFQGN